MEMMSWLNNHDLLFLVDSVLPWAHSPAGELGAGFLSPCGLTSSRRPVWAFSCDGGIIPGGQVP